VAMISGLLVILLIIVFYAIISADGLFA